MLPLRNPNPDLSKVFEFIENAMDDFYSRKDVDINIKDVVYREFMIALYGSNVFEEMINFQIESRR
jgi:hypothetical protein